MPHVHTPRPYLLPMPHRRRSASECLTSMPLDHASSSSFGLGMPHDLADYRWQRCALSGKGVQSQSRSPIQTRLKGLRRPPTDHCTALDTQLILHADKEPATPSNMDAQRQNTKKSSSKKVPKTPAPRSVSRSSSMQVEDGREVSTTETSSKSQGKGNCDSSYSMDRWLSQKPSEEPWHGSGR
jgi:hypothetical protein